MQCPEIPRDFSEIISENIFETISEKSSGISKQFPGIWRFVETVERYSKSVKCSSKFINPRLKVGMARGQRGLWRFMRVSRRGDISGEEIITKHHGNETGARATQ